MSRQVFAPRLLAWLALPLLAGLAGFGVAREGSVVRPASWAGEDRLGGTRPGHRSRGTREVDAAPDILLITVDALRADAVAAGRARPSKAPLASLRQVAASGTRYTHAFAPSSRSAPSLEVILGLEAGQRDGADGTTPGLAEILASEGYATTAITSPEAAPEEILGGFRQVHRDAPESSAAFTRWISDRAEGLGRRSPWFVWIHVGPGPAGTPTAEDPASALQAYRAHASEVDSVIGAAMEALATDEGTVVAVAATHGYALDDEGELGAGSSLSAAQTRVPLLIAGPEDQPAGQVARGPVGLDALPATLADLVGARRRTLGGSSLLRSGRLSPPRRRAVVSTFQADEGEALHAIALGRWRLVERSGGRPPALHEATAPPGDCPDLASRYPEERAWMEERLEDVVRLNVP